MFRVEGNCPSGLATVSVSLSLSLSPPLSYVSSYLFVGAGCTVDGQNPALPIIRNIP